MIEQPRRRTAGRPLRFHAICPACLRLLVLDDGIWPHHWWDDANPVMQCYMVGKPHASLETKP